METGKVIRLCRGQLCFFGGFTVDVSDYFSVHSAFNVIERREERRTERLKRILRSEELIHTRQDDIFSYTGPDSSEYIKRCKELVETLPHDNYAKGIVLRWPEEIGGCSSLQERFTGVEDAVPEELTGVFYSRIPRYKSLTMNIQYEAEILAVEEVEFEIVF